MTNLNLVMLDAKGRNAMQTFNDYEVVEGKNVPVSNIRELTLYDLIKSALLSSMTKTKSDRVLTRYQLFKKIQYQSEVEFTEEEKELIIKLVCKKYEIIFAGQVIEALS